MVVARPEVEVGAELEVAVTVRAEIAVSHLPMTLRFDPKRLEVVKVTQGPFLGGEGAATLLSDRSRPGHLVLGPSRLGRVSGVSGQGEVARITFRPLLEGAARIRFSAAAALDETLADLAVERRGLELQVVPPGSLPPLERPQVGDRPDVERRPPERR
jgi:hypothetical protein